MADIEILVGAELDPKAWGRIQSQLKKEKFNVEINLEDNVSKELASIESRLQNLSKLGKGITIIDKSAFDTKALNNFSKSLENIQKKMSATGSKGGLGKNLTSGFKESIKDIQTLENQLIRFKNASDKAFGNKSATSFRADSLINDLRKAETSTEGFANNVKNIQREFNNLKIDFDTQKTQADLKALENNAKNLIDRINQMKSSPGFDVVSQTEIAEVKQLEDALESVQRKLKDGSLGKIDVSNLKQAFDQVNNATKEANKGLGLTSGGFQKFGGAIQGVAGKIGGVITQFFGLYQAINQVRKAMEFSIELDSRLTEIAMVTNQSREDVKGLAREYNDLAKSMNLTTDFLSEGAVGLYRQGLSEDEVKERLQSIAKFAKVANVQMSQAEEYITAAVNGMGVTAERASDVFVNLGDSAATSAEEISIAMSKVSGTAGVLDIPFEKVASWIAVISETTREAPQSIGTALNTVLNRLQNMTKSGFEEVGAEINDAANALKEAAGINLFEEGTQNMRDIATVMDELGDKWHDLNSAEQARISTGLAGIRNASRFMTLMENYARSVELYDGALGSAGSTQAKFETYMDSMQASIDRTKAAWESLVITLVDDGTFKSVADGITSIIEGFERLVKSVGGVKATLTGLGSLLGGIGLAKGAGSLLAGTVATKAAAGLSVGLGTKALGGIGAALGGPVGTVIGLAIGAAIAKALSSFLIGKNPLKSLENNVEDVTKKAEELSGEFKKISLEDASNAQFDSMLNSMDGLQRQTIKTTEETERLNQMQRELAETFPELTSGYDSDFNPIAQDVDQAKELLALQKEINQERHKMAVEEAQSGLGDAKNTMNDIAKQINAQQEASAYIKNLRDEIEATGESAAGMSKEYHKAFADISDIFKKHGAKIDESAIRGLFEGITIFGADKQVARMDEYLADASKGLADLRNQYGETNIQIMKWNAMLDNQQMIMNRNNSTYKAMKNDLSSLEGELSNLGYSLENSVDFAYMFGKSNGSYGQAQDGLRGILDILTELQITSDQFSMEEAFAWLDVSGDMTTFTDRLRQVHTTLQQFESLGMTLGQGMNLYETMDWDFDAYEQVTQIASELRTAFETLTVDEAIQMGIKIQADPNVTREAAVNTANQIKEQFAEISDVATIDFAIQINTNELNMENVMSTVNQLLLDTTLSQNNALQVSIDIHANQLSYDSLMSTMAEIQSQIKGISDTAALEFAVQMGVADVSVADVNAALSLVENQLNIASSGRRFEVAIMVASDPQGAEAAMKKLDALVQDYSVLSEQEIISVMIEVGGDVDAAREILDQRSEERQVTVDTVINNNIQSEIDSQEYSAEVNLTTNIDEIPLIEVEDTKVEIEVTEPDTTKAQKKVDDVKQKEPVKIKSDESGFSTKKSTSEMETFNKAINQARTSYNNLRNLPNINKTATFRTVYQTVGSPSGGARGSASVGGIRRFFGLDDIGDYSQYVSQVRDGVSFSPESRIVTFDSPFRTSLGSGGITPVSMGTNSLAANSTAEMFARYNTDSIGFENFNVAFNPSINTTRIKEGADMYKRINALLERNNFLQDRNNELQTYHENDLKKVLPLMNQEIDLLEERQVLLNHNANQLRAEREELKKALSTQGFDFTGSGDTSMITNLEHMQNFTEEKLKSLSEAGTDVNKMFDRFIAIQTTEIPKASLEWWKLENQVRKVAEAQSDAIFNDIKSQIDTINRAVDTISWERDMLNLTAPDDMAGKIELLARQQIFAEESAQVLMNRMAELSNHSFPAGSAEAQAFNDKLYEMSKMLRSTQLEMARTQDEMRKLEEQASKDYLAQWNNRMNNLSSIEDSLVEIIRKRGERERDEINKSKQAELDALSEREKAVKDRNQRELDGYNDMIRRKIEMLNRQHEQEDFDAQLEREREIEEKLIFEYEVLQQDDSQRGRKLAIQKEQELAEQRQKIADMVRDHNRQKEIDHLNDMLKEKEEQVKADNEITNSKFENEKKGIEANYDRQMELWERQYSNASMYAEAYKAMMDGQVQYIDGSMKSVQNAIMQLETEHGRAAGVMGAKIQTEIVGNWNEATNALAEYIQMLQGMSYSFKDGWTPPRDAYASDIDRGMQSALDTINKLPAGFKGWDMNTFAQYVANKIMWETGDKATRDRANLANKQIRQDMGMRADDDKYGWKELYNMVDSSIQELINKLAGKSSVITTSSPRKADGFERMSDSHYLEYVNNKANWEQATEAERKALQAKNLQLRQMYGITDDLYSLSDMMGRFQQEFRDVIGGVYSNPIVPTRQNNVASITDYMRSATAGISNLSGYGDVNIPITVRGDMTQEGADRLTNNLKDTLAQLDREREIQMKRNGFRF